MSEFNPVELIGNSAQQAVDQAKALPAFSSSNVANSAQTLLQGGQQVLAATLSEVGDRAFSIQQKLFPAKKLVTFMLYDKNGNLVQPTDASFQPGYAFNMAINPSALTINYPNKSVTPVRTMGGWVLQHWYPELGSLSADGIVGNLLQRWNTDTKQAPRWDSFKKLIRVYQNNGVVYQPSNLDRNNVAFNPVAVCVYDSVTYKGYFENFSYSEEQEQPYTRKYNFSFRFVEMVETENMVELTSKLSSLAANATGVLNSAQGLATAVGR